MAERYEAGGRPHQWPGRPISQESCHVTGLAPVRDWMLEHLEHRQTISHHPVHEQDAI